MAKKVREPIYVALFEKLKGIEGLKTASRKLKHWDDVEKLEMPALFQMQGRETPTQSRGMPTVWDLSVTIFVYAYSEDGTPSTPLNNIIDDIEDALKPNSQGVQDLGGLVSHCWITGVETFEGLLGNKEVAMIPIGIKMANDKFS